MQRDKCSAERYVEREREINKYRERGGRERERERERSIYIEREYAHYNNAGETTSAGHVASNRHVAGI